MWIVKRSWAANADQQRDEEGARAQGLDMVEHGGGIADHSMLVMPDLFRHPPCRDART
ncbi:MAG: hypothetical protein WDN44_13825 [Sphingomonas sp.]